MSEILFEKTINNLYENGNITFFKLKEMFNNVSNFSLEKIELPKGKKILLSYNIREGKIIIANNKSEIKNEYKNINEYLKTCDESKEEIFNSLNILEKNINTLTHEQQNAIFGDSGKVFYNLEIIKKPSNCNDFNTKHFILLNEGHGEYDIGGKLIVTEVERQVNKLQELLNEWEKRLKYEKYNIQSSAIRKLYQLNEKDYYNYANNKIDNSLSSVNSYINNEKFILNDNSTIDDYILSRIYVLLNGLLEKSDTQQFNAISKMNIAKRILGIKGIGIQDINKFLDHEQQKFVKENILNDKNKKDLLKTSIKPIEEIIINYSLDILKTIQSIILLSNLQFEKRLNKQIENSINYISNGNNLLTLKHELKALKHIDKYLNKPEYSFFYEGNAFKYNNNYQPINELLKMFKPFTNNSNKNIIDENEMYNIVNETIRKKNNKYCLLSKKTKKILGCYNSLTDAKKREKQVQFFKSFKEQNTISSGAIQIAVDNRKNKTE
jgi:hypothetical protein